MYKIVAVSLLTIILCSCSKQKDLAPQEHISYYHWYETSGAADTLFSVYIPNAFSPNGDEKNDDFYPKGRFIFKNLKIFNKYNNVIFETSDNEPWRGNTQNGKDKVSQGIYIYELRVVDNVGNKHEYTGSVMVMR